MWACRRQTCKNVNRSRSTLNNELIGAARRSPHSLIANTRVGFLWFVGHADATEASAECIGSGGIRETKSNVGLLGFVSASATANRDVVLTVEGVKV
jgi:hypothetical protein